MLWSFPILEFLIFFKRKFFLFEEFASAAATKHVATPVCGLKRLSDGKRVYGLRGGIETTP